MQQRDSGNVASEANIDKYRATPTPTQVDISSTIIATPTNTSAPVLVATFTPKSVLKPIPLPVGQVHMWVYLVTDDYALKVYVDSGNPISRNELDLFVNGTKFCNTNNIYSGLLQKLGCGWLEGGLSSQPQVWAEVAGTHLMECIYQGDENENMVFACNYKE